MCKVKDLKYAEKRIFVILKDGGMVCSDWVGGDNDEIIHDKTVYRQTLEEAGLEANDVTEWYVSRKHDGDADTVYISEHAMDRLKSRNGWNRKASMRMIKKVYDNGLTPDAVRGRFATWVRHKEDTKNPGDEFRLYGDYLYVFNRQTLVTVLPTPKKGSFYNQAYKQCA